MQHYTGTFTGKDNLQIFTQHWLPDDGPPRAVVLLAHGIAEHSGRYAHVAAHLTAHGYALYALDHRGHGQSGGGRGVIDRFEDFVTDLATYSEQVRAAHPDRPEFAYGHSMGSLIALHFAAAHQDELAGLILTGTAIKVADSPAPVAALLRIVGLVAPQAALLPVLSAEGISRDPDVVARYENDPLVYRGRLRIRLAAEVLRAGHTARELLPSLRIPVLALHGGADPLTLPEGAEVVREESGAPDTTVTIYEGLYHDVHNEPEQARVLADITDWLDAHTEA